MIEKGEVCLVIKALIEQKQYECTYELVVNHMRLAPDDASWHSLLGILYEKQGNRVGDMKRFRTTWVLDAACPPARWNMESYGDFEKDGKTCVYLAEEYRCGQAEKDGREYEAV